MWNGMLNVECGMLNGCAMRNVEFGVWNVEWLAKPMKNEVIPHSNIPHRQRRPFHTHQSTFHTHIRVIRRRSPSVHL